MISRMKGWSTVLSQTAKRRAFSSPLLLLWLCIMLCTLLDNQWDFEWDIMCRTVSRTLVLEDVGLAEALNDACFEILLQGESCELQMLWTKHFLTNAYFDSHTFWKARVQESTCLWMHVWCMSRKSHANLLNSITSCEYLKFRRPVSWICTLFCLTISPKFMPDQKEHYRKH